MTDRDLGALGELKFKELCITAGLIPQKSEMDKTGWDFLVEFPWREDSNTLQDLLPPPLICKIQVKSTDKKRKGENITLSNLHRLIKDQMPVFFCFIEFDGENSPQDIYLVHVGKKIIEKTLKKTRELGVSGIEKKLNRTSIRIGYGKKDRLDNLSGEALRSKIEYFVPDGLENYTREKNTLIKTLGYEDGRYEFTITMAGKKSFLDVIDNSLGIGEEMVDIHRFMGYHKRFGIISEDVDSGFDGGKISLTVKPLSCWLEFKEEKFSPGVIFPANLYVSPLSRLLPADLHKLRVDSHFFEFIAEPNIGINYKIQRLHEKSSLKELNNLLKVFSMIEDTSKSLLIELQPENSKPVVLMEIESASFPPEFQKGIITGEVSHSWSETYELSKMVIQICEAVHVSSEKLMLDFSDLIFGVAMSADAQTIYQFFYGSAKVLQVQSYMPSDGWVDGVKVAVIFFAKAVIGNYHFGFCLTLVGKLSLLAEGLFTVQGEESMIGHRFVGVEGVDLLSEELIEPALNELEDLWQAKKIPVIRIPL
jgi:predicted DNA-binding protein